VQCFAILGKEQTFQLWHLSLSGATVYGHDLRVFVRIEENAGKDGANHFGCL